MTDITEHPTREGKVYCCVELAAAIQHYIEDFHNHRRRHSALNMLTPTEYENHYQSTIAA